MFAPFVAKTVGQRLAEWSLHVPELLRQTLLGTPRICPLHAGQDEQAYRLLIQGLIAEQF